MSRILTGIQSSGRPHLANLLGAIIPSIKLSKQNNNESFFFIADLHALTSIKDPKVRQQNTEAVAAAWIAMGFDTQNNFLYRQSRIPIVNELSWYLSCLAPYPMLANAHSFKEKSSKLSDVSVGLFTYPVLMASDILLYDAEFVPVGKDQKQHLEIVRDLATTFNNQFGDTLVVPEAIIDETVMTVPGTDGQKMSKSYNNTIDIFLPEKDLKKQVMSIVTDSKQLKDPKDPETDNVYALYKLVASKEQSEAMHQKYLAGNFGYGHAKNELFSVLIERFKRERELFNRLMSDPEHIEKTLIEGESKASAIAHKVINRVRNRLGLA